MWWDYVTLAARYLRDGALGGMAVGFEMWGGSWYGEGSMLPLPVVVFTGAPFALG